MWLWAVLKVKCWVTTDEWQPFLTGLLLGIMVDSRRDPGTGLRCRQELGTCRKPQLRWVLWKVNPLGRGCGKIR